MGDFERFYNLIKKEEQKLNMEEEHFLLTRTIDLLNTKNKTLSKETIDSFKDSLHDKNGLYFAYINNFVDEYIETFLEYTNDTKDVFNELLSFCSNFKWSESIVSRSKIIKQITEKFNGYNVSISKNAEFEIYDNSRYIDIALVTDFIKFVDLDELDYNFDKNMKFTNAAKFAQAINGEVLVGFHHEKGIRKIYPVVYLKSMIYDVNKNIYMLRDSYMELYDFEVLTSYKPLTEDTYLGMVEEEAALLLSIYKVYENF